MPGIVTKAAKRNLAPDWLRLRRNNGIDAAALQSAKHLAVGVSSVSSDRRDRPPGQRHGRIEAFDNHLTLVGLSGRHFDIEDDAAKIVDHRVLFVSRFETSIAPVRRHAGVGISCANFLELAVRAAGFLRLCRVSIGFVDRVDMPGDAGSPS